MTSAKSFDPMFTQTTNLGFDKQKQRSLGGIETPCLVQEYKLFVCGRELH
jgi:hypothetical protein